LKKKARSIPRHKLTIIHDFSEHDKKKKDRQSLKKKRKEKEERNGQDK